MYLRTALQSLALGLLIALPACTLAQGMGSMNMGGKGQMASGQMVAPAQVFDKALSGVEQEFVGAAEAMPADKFNFAPPTSMGNFTGVRTFADEVKHVATANYGMFRGFNVPGAKTGADIDKLTSRDEILAALKQSFQYAHSAIATITAQNAFASMGANGGTRAGAALHAISHPQDHYGQMVEYLRMNGIIPPASRK